MEPKRVAGLVRLMAALGFAAAAAVVAVLVTVAAGALAASLGARWAAKRREQGLDDPIAIVQQRARQAKEWLDSRRSPADDA